MSATEMLQAHPRAEGALVDVLARCIDACRACVETCIACADACLAEEHLGDLRRCIRLDLDGVDICGATANVLTRPRSEEAWAVRAIVEACRDVCNRCGAECEKHAGEHEHCRVNAESCRRCERACEELLAAL
jgi:hypothetical protein